MKKYYIIIALLICVIWTSCTKEKMAAGLSSLNVINANADISSLTVNFTITPIPFYQQQAILSYGSGIEYGNPGGSLPLTLISTADTLHHLFQASLNLPPGSIHSLYIAGTLQHIDTVFMQDNIPPHTDSTSGARFINLSTDSGPVSINLQGAATTEFSGLAYKKITAFKSYSAVNNITTNGGYTYEVRDASNGVLTTFNWNPVVFKNYTLVISGNSNAGVQVFAVNNF